MGSLLQHCLHSVKLQRLAQLWLFFWEVLLKRKMLDSVQLCILFLSVCPSVYLFFQLLSCYQLRLALMSQFSCLFCLLMLSLKLWTTTPVFSFYSLIYKLLLDSFSFQFISVEKHTMGMESLYTLGIVLFANLPSFRIFFWLQS